MTLCQMNAHQIAAYVNTWAELVTVVISSAITWAIQRAVRTMEADEAYARGVTDTEARLRPTSLYLGLSDYDAQRLEAGRE